MTFPWQKNNFFRQTWFPIMSKGTPLLLLSTRPGKHPWNSMKISLVEAKAYEEVRFLCRKMGKDLEIERSNTSDWHEFIKKISSRNFIVLGSPFANPLCNKLWEELKNEQLPFDFKSEKRKFTLLKKEGNGIKKKGELNLHYFTLNDLEYKPKLNISAGKYYEDVRWNEDYGLIVRSNNPFDENKEKKMILAMGCHSVGTYGAINMMTNEKWVKELYKKTGNRDFALLVKFSFIEGNLNEKKILVHFDLSTKKTTVFPG